MLGDVAKHREQRDRPGFWFFGRRKERDNLFERSFQTCAGCGGDVYVLAEDCRDCGHAVELVAV
jgi:hypothetical protein